MRLAAMACALVIVMCVAVFGAILSQRSSAPIASTSPAQAASSDGPVRVVTTLEDASPPAPVQMASKAAAAADTATIPNSPTTSAQGGGTPAAVPAPAPAAVLAQAPAAAAPAAPALVPAPAAAPPQPAAVPPAAVASCPGNPNALGVSRTVEIDTTGGPGFGFEHFKTHDFLRDGEVVLTFDDGPWPKNTQAVLAALQAHCTKAIFFPIGLHATYEPGILKLVAAAGHAVGSHTWCHQDLSKTKGHCLVNGKRETVEYDPKDEIEKGVSAVRWAVGGPTAPYFRFPALRQPPELLAYLGTRNIAVFSTDFDSFDFKMRRPEQVRQSVMAKLKKHGKGIVLMHDFQHATAEATADLLNDLKAGGYKVVFMKPKFPVKTIASYDEMILKSMPNAVGDGRPTSSVVRTISE
jgi:peptidoglycan/xylan/chitin deacetylase (PgdA/CDA1 family)